ncbi:uncharacterized protein M6B38_168150 [Iris pallida]|uniref:Uncharacterized protein n=1 Tax=Iris pallida TaxID=29817 RepID=A0AAX6E8D7_IRIPA|nr:uncharacterized protein M6B38_203230 [Iris pallida]KAJ6808166.1 uncharacterized protein M6B38_168150 [Iris pallida]
MPSCTEDEERMIMEAIIESLKDLETKHPQEDAQSNAGTAQDNSSSDGVQVSPAELPWPSSQTLASTLTAEQKRDTIVLCTTAESSSNNKSNNSGNTTAEPSINNKSISSGNTTAEPSINNKSNSSGNTSEGSQSAACGSISTKQSCNMADGTRATVVVQKNPSSMLLKDWHSTGV